MNSATWRAQPLLISLVGLSTQQFSKSHSWGLNLSTWGSHTNGDPLKIPEAVCLAWQDPGSLCQKQGKNQIPQYVMRAPFPTPARANPAPLTKTWKGTDTILELCEAESSSAIFILVIESILHPVYGCRLGRSAQGDMLCVIPISQLLEIFLPVGLQRKTYSQKRRWQGW